jgi:5-methylcytosine-specific restriction endonuclease McrA
MVKHYRLEIKKEILEIFYQMKNVPPATNSNDRGAESFINLIKSFHQKYQVQSRQTKLSQVEKESLIKEQGNRCGISGAPIFLGDEIEIDHKKSLAIGGSDSKENLQITHKDSNRRKGAK